MGNKKTKLNHCNNQCHVYKKCRPLTEEKRSEENTDAQTAADSTLAMTIEGSRIINVHKLQQYIHQLTVHAKQCGASVVLSGEVRDGLASILSTHCSVCGHSMTLETAEKVKGPRGYRHWESNLAGVWGQMVTGGGHTRLEEIMSVLGVPVTSKKTFIETVHDIGEWWRLQLKEAMIAAGKEEKRLAEERGDYHAGIPVITVVVDGGWSKRSHRHSYNAKYAVGIILGKETGKPLHIGVCNKFCTACTQGNSTRQTCLLQELE